MHRSRIKDNFRILLFCVFRFLYRAYKMSYVLIIIFSLITLIHSAPKVTTKTTFWDIPTGHCDPICSCQKDGLYYSEGEQWAKPEDPCTVYKCFKNGFVEPVQKGCWYKEQCHVVNSTWSEGCNNFTCTEKADSVHYKLTEAGCSLSSGRCLALGKRLKDGCDVLECQLDGDCLKTKTLRTGCAVQGTCKRIDSYWHDGCTVYTCANESNSAVTKTLANELMQWPEGNYAMLKPQTGCPSDVPQVWSEGSRKHYGAGQNIFSRTLSLAGKYTSKFMRHDFCIHGTNFNNAMLPKYKTYWEPGSYCILRRNGVCPRGFSDGYISFDDNEKISKSVSTGVLPDGDFLKKTGLYFCCRKDGSVLTEIVLPKDENFVLFMQNGETKCQTIRGMSHSVEFVTFDGLPNSKHEKRGLTPSVKIVDGDLTLTFCHYNTKECGCADPSGQFIAVNTQKEINCVIKKCISEMGMNIIKIVSGGCLVNGKCQPEGSKWSVNLGETCRIQTCQRVLAGPTTTFEVKDGLQGCRDGDACKSVGEEMYRGCYTSRCTKYPVSNIIAFKVIKAECPWLETCKAPNTTWTHHCMKYRCDMNVVGEHYQPIVQPVTYGCNDGKGNCYKIGENVSGQCFDAVCRLSENKTVVYLDVMKGGCAWKDSCKTVNATWKDGCHHFKCEWIDTKTGFTAIVNATDVSCEWNNTCYKENEMWSDGCIDYKCNVTREADAVNWGVHMVHLGCKDFNNTCIDVGKEFIDDCVTYRCNHNGGQIGLDAVAVGCSFNHTCMKENSTWQDGCKTRKCVVQRTNQIGRSIAAIRAECDDEGTCRKVGYKKVTDTCMHYKCIFNSTYNDSVFSLLKGSCRATDGQCHDVGKTWTEKRNDSCLVYKCYKEQIGFLSRMLEQKCLDANGNCHSVGASGFPARINGKLQRYCSCNLSTTQYPPGIVFQCTG